MKNIVRINHNSKIFDHFNSDGNLEGITTKYSKLLNLTTDDGCKEGYKKCGILDTLGNTLCIDNNFGCPINKLTVDLHAKKNNHLKQGLKEIYNENLIYNYNFYYSNESLGGNSIVSLLFSDEKPRYISLSNFIVDLAAYKHNYNDHLNSKNDDNEDNGIKFGEDIISIFVPDDYVEKIFKASLSLISLIEDSDNNKEKFKEYVVKKLETEENKVDKYYINVGENAYIKNYIGFKSLNDINRFMNFDYNIYKKKYPNYAVYVLASINSAFGLLALLGSIIYYIYLYIKHKRDFDCKNIINQSNGTVMNLSIDKNDNKSNTIPNFNICDFEPKKEHIVELLLLFIVFGLNISLIVLTIVSLCRNHNNKEKLKILNNIESDDFIRDFLYEFKKECKASSLIIPSIALYGSATLLILVGTIFMFVLILILEKY